MRLVGTWIRTFSHLSQKEDDIRVLYERNPRAMKLSFDMFFVHYILSIAWYINPCL